MHAHCSVLTLVVLKALSKRIVCIVIGAVTVSRKPIGQAGIALGRESFSNSVKWPGESLANSGWLSAGSNMTTAFSAESPFMLASHWPADKNAAAFSLPNRLKFLPCSEHKFPCSSEQGIRRQVLVMARKIPRRKAISSRPHRFSL